MVKLHKDSIQSIPKNKIDIEVQNTINNLVNTLNDIKSVFENSSRTSKQISTTNQHDTQLRLTQTENQCDTQQKSDIDDSSPKSKSLESSPSP